MKKTDWIWTPEKMTTYLAHPMVIVPGTFMSFAGLPNAKDIAYVVGFLKTKSPASEPTSVQAPK